MPVTDKDRDDAAGAIVNGWLSCRRRKNADNIGRAPQAPDCGCDEGRIGACMELNEAVAKAIASARGQ
jgi:hypothetical protein